MNRRDVLRGGALAGLTGLAGCSSGYRRNAGFADGFEDGREGWEFGASIGPEQLGSEFDWAIDVSREQAASGERSLRVFTEGDHDDGTAWAAHPVDVETGNSYEATVALQAWSPSESFNTLRHLVARLGAERPASESDFPDPGVNTTTVGGAPYGGLREPLHLQEGWREYSFAWTTPRLETDTLFVACGVSVVWEADATHFVDDVRVDLSER